MNPMYKETYTIMCLNFKITLLILILLILYIVILQGLTKKKNILFIRRIFRITYEKSL